MSVTGRLREGGCPEKEANVWRKKRETERERELVQLYKPALLIKRMN